MTYPENINVTVEIDGVDRTSYITPGSFDIKSKLTAKLDTCTFTMEKARAVEPTEWQEVIVRDGTEKIFGGYIVSKEEEVGNDLDVDFLIAASDYGILTEKSIIKAEYLQQTDGYILADLFATYLPTINATTFVATVETHERIRFNRFTLREAIDLLAGMAEAEWFIDYDRNLHFFQGQDSVAPFSLSQTPDNSTSYPFDDLVKFTDGTGAINRVEIVGGDYLSDDHTILVAGTGQDERVIMPFRMKGPLAGGGIVVHRNDGTETAPVWTALTEKPGYIDALVDPNDVLHYFQEKVLEQTDTWPNLPNAVRIRGRFEIPLRTRVRDNISYAFYGQAQWFDAVINDPDITDKSTATLRGKALLAQQALGRVAVRLSTRKPGLSAGMMLAIDSPLHSVNDSFLIQEVNATIGDRRGNLVLP